MPKKEKFTAEEMIVALTETKGLPALAADRLRCTSRTVYKYIERHPTVKEAFEHQREIRLDHAEARLWTNIENGDNTAIIFFLKTQGKHRGYVERVEHGGMDGNEITLRVKYGNDATDD